MVSCFHAGDSFVEVRGGLFRLLLVIFFFFFLSNFVEFLPWADFSVLFRTGLPVDPALHYGINLMLML